MKLLNTLQALVDKTKELEETVATQTSTIERLTDELSRGNKDTDKADIKQEYQELRDKFFRTLFSQVVVRNAVVDNKIILKTSDIFDGKGISVILTNCYTATQYGYIINLTNSTEVLDKIIKEVTSIVDLDNDNNTITDTTDNNSCQPIVDRMIKDILSVSKGSRVSPLLAFLVHYNYIEHYRCNFHWQSDIERYKLEFTFDYNGKEYKLADNETIDFAKRLLIKLYTNQSDTVRDQLITNFVEWYSEHHIATNSDTECDITTDTKHLFDTTLQPIIDKGELLQFAERYDYLSTPKKEHQYLPLHLIRHIVYAYYIDNQRQFFINVANWLTNNSIANIKQTSDTIKLANDITTKLSTINPDLRPATNLSEFLLHYGYIHGYTRSNYYNEITYEFDYKGKRYTLHQYDTLTQVKHIITDIVNKDLEHLIDNYTDWTIANNNNKQ